MPSKSERLEILRQLLRPMVRIDELLPGLTNKLQSLPARGTAAHHDHASLVALQDKLDRWVDPIQEELSRALTASYGVGQHLEGLIRDAQIWEVETRQLIRRFKDVLVGLVGSLATEREETFLNGCGFELWERGQPLQAACELLEASANDVTPDGPIPSVNTGAIDHALPTRLEQAGGDRASAQPGGTRCGLGVDSAPPASRLRPGWPEKGERTMNVAELAECLKSAADQVYPTDLDPKAVELLHFYSCGVGGPVGSDDWEPIPRFWCAAGEVKDALNSMEFEEMCATMELKAHGHIAQTLRKHADSLLEKCESADQSIQRECTAATATANKICCEFVGAPNPEKHELLINASSLRNDLAFDGGNLGGDPSKRVLLGDAILKGPPSIWTLSLRPGDDPKAVAEKYWSILASADCAIRKIRYQLRAAIERVVTFLSVLERAKVDGELPLSESLLDLDEPESREKTSSNQAPSVTAVVPVDEREQGSPCGAVAVGTHDSGLATVRRAVEWHRLMFLFWAQARRQNPLSVRSKTGVNERVQRDEIRGWDEMLKAIDKAGEFLWTYRDVLNRYAEAAVEAFGPGEGSRPIELGSSGVAVPVEGGTLPYWIIDEGAPRYLEESSDAILESARRAGMESVGQLARDLIKSAIDVSRPDGHPRWYTSVVIRWNYLADLDDLIVAIKRAEASGGEIDAAHARVAPTGSASAATEALTASNTAESLQMLAADRRNSALCVLMLLAQGYYKMLECVIGTASWCNALDLELNQSYLWVTGNLINLLKNHEDLKDFPTPFQPYLPDLYPSTVRDLEWGDMVAPTVEGFLSTVQGYVHSKGIHEPERGSTAWIFVELFRPSVEDCIKRAEAYGQRMRKYMNQMLDRAGATPPAPPPVPDAHNTQPVVPATVPGGQRERAQGARTRGRRRDARADDAAVRDYIRGERAKGVPLDRITRAAVSASTGIPTGTVSGTSAWTNFSAERGSARSRPAPGGEVIGDAVHDRIESGAMDDAVDAEALDAAIQAEDWVRVKALQDKEAKKRRV